MSDFGGDVTAATALTDTDTATVTVHNVPPTVTAVGDEIDEGETATVSATFIDPGTLDTHTASIDWGDGTSPEAVTTEQLAAGVDHVYGDNGAFDVTVTVTDDDLGAGESTSWRSRGEPRPRGHARRLGADHLPWRRLLRGRRGRGARAVSRGHRCRAPTT